MGRASNGKLDLFTVSYKRVGYGATYLMRVRGTSSSAAAEAVIDFELSRGYQVDLSNNAAAFSAQKWQF